MRHGSDENNSFIESFYQVEMIDEKAPPPPPFFYNVYWNNLVDKKNCWDKIEAVSGEYCILSTIILKEYLIKTTSAPKHKEI